MQYPPGYFWFSGGVVPVWSGGSGLGVCLARYCLRSSAPTPTARAVPKIIRGSGMGVGLLLTVVAPISTGGRLAALAGLPWPPRATQPPLASRVIDTKLVVNTFLQNPFEISR